MTDADLSALTAQVRRIRNLIRELRDLPPLGEDEE